MTFDAPTLRIGPVRPDGLLPVSLGFGQEPGPVLHRFITGVPALISNRDQIVRHIVIAVDGPAAAGKGTLCRALAARFGFDHMETGLLYRALAAKALASHILVPDEDHLAAITITMADLQSPFLKEERIGAVASVVSALPKVRAALLQTQLDFAQSPPGGRGAILDGRDIGTKVAPEAILKLFLTADPEVRARRRHADELAAGRDTTLDEVLRSIQERDHREATRTVDRMVPADDAVVIDTTDLSPGELETWVVDLFLGRVLSLAISGGITREAVNVLAAPMWSYLSRFDA